MWIILSSSICEIVVKVITGLPNGPVLFCWLSSVVVCTAAGGRTGRECGNAASGRAERRPGAWTVGRPTRQGGSVVLRPVMATPCSKCCVINVLLFSFEFASCYKVIQTYMTGAMLYLDSIHNIFCLAALRLFEISCAIG